MLLPYLACTSSTARIQLRNLRTPSPHFMQFCMFHAGLPDILPVGDLGVRRGLAKLYDLTELPDAVMMETLTQHWRPYRTVGSYFMWRVEVPHGAYSPSKGKRKAAKAAP